MTKLSEHHSTTQIKMLNIADTGAGKTGALASLAAAGYKLNIIDCDNGLDVLRSVLKESAPEALDNVDYETCTNEYKSVNGRVLPKGQPKAFARAVGLMDNWPGIGNVGEWGPERILCIDSLTLLSRQAMEHVQSLTPGRVGQPPQLQEWGEAMRLIENMLGLLYSDAVRCRAEAAAEGW